MQCSKRIFLPFSWWFIFKLINISLFIINQNSFSTALQMQNGSFLSVQKVYHFISKNVSSNPIAEENFRRNLILFTAIQEFNASLMDFYFHPFLWKNAFLLDDVLYRHLIHESYYRNTSSRKMRLKAKIRELRAAESDVDDIGQVLNQPMKNQTQTNIPNFTDLASFDGAALFSMTSNATLRLISIFELEHIFRARFRQLILHKNSTFPSENKRAIIETVLSSIDRFKKSVMAFYQEQLNENAVSKLVLNDSLRSYLNITFPKTFKTIHDLHTLYIGRGASHLQTHPQRKIQSAAFNFSLSEIAKKNLEVYYKPLTFDDKSAIPNVLHMHLKFEKNYTLILRNQQDKSNFIEIFQGSLA